MTYSEKAKQYIGIKQGSRQHREIIDYYNNTIRPLPRGYRVKYTDSWCAAFVSAILSMCGAKNAPYECSCVKMLARAKQQKQATKNPQINDIIFYDWGNNGTVDHVGIISGITGNYYYVIEGNYSKSVKIRMIHKKSKEIEAFISVPCSSNVPTSTDNDRITQLAMEVIQGKYGSGSDRKKALGADYKEVQNRVNQILGYTD